jgi:beta-galactosidase
MNPKRDLSHLPWMLYGGDYNPEQWPESVWAEDVRLMQDAGVNLVSLGIFSWAKIEPREGEFHFDWLDRIIDLLHAGGIRVDLATATAAPPPWMAKNYPDSLPMTREGHVLYPGSRQQYDPHSTAYFDLSSRLVTKIAERYGKHPAVVMWHINNEYACHVAESFTPAGTAAFRAWLEKRYGTIDALNHAWGTAFWSQRYDDWSEIHPPRLAPTFLNPTQQLDWKRFSDYALQRLFRNEVDILRRITPDIPVVTNFMGFFKATDYWEWAKHEDIVSEDCYPDPMDPHAHIETAIRYDLMRSLRSGQPWLLMEQTPANVNWRPRNALKKPNVMRLWSYQAVSRAANGIMFFQWRAAKAGAEKFHGAMVPHAGADTRTYREVAQLGNELKKLADLTTTTTHADVAMVFDWENWWVLEQESHPSSDITMMRQVGTWYAMAHKRNLPVDFVPSSVTIETLRKYKLLLVPNLYLTRAGVAEVFEQYVREGGVLVMGPFSGIADENDHIWLGGYPAPFKNLLGIHIEENEALGKSNRVITDDEDEFTCESWRDAITLRGAQGIARFGDDYFADAPAMTRNAFGTGGAYYVGTQLGMDALDWVIGRAVDEAQVKPALDVPAGVEVLVRKNAEKRFLFLLNHADTNVRVKLPTAMTDLISGARHEGVIELDVAGVAVLTEGER